MRSPPSQLLSRLSLALCCALTLASVWSSTGCSRDKPDLSQMSREAEAKEAKLKQERDAVAAREAAALDELIPRVIEKRKPLDKAFGVIWQNLPELKNIKLKSCPDPKITADTPDEAKRAVLVINKESAFTLTGRAKAAPDGGAEQIHTVAAYHAFSMKRPEGKETPLLDAAPPASAEQARAQLEAADFISAHRYIGVVLISAFKEADNTSVKPTPARLEGWTVIFDRETGKPLCQIEASGESIAQSDSASGGGLAAEEAWYMYLHTTAKNLDAISKVLSIEGISRKKR
jgi:hypothetical protein